MLLISYSTCKNPTVHPLLDRAHRYVDKAHIVSAVTSSSVYFTVGCNEGRGRGSCSESDPTHSDNCGVQFAFIEDLLAEVSRIAKFLGVDLSYETLSTVVSHCQFNSMKENKMANRDGVWLFNQKVSKFMRKGQSLVCCLVPALLCSQLTASAWFIA